MRASPLLVAVGLLTLSLPVGAATAFSTYTSPVTKPSDEPSQQEVPAKDPSRDGVALALPHVDAPDVMDDQAGPSAGTPSAVDSAVDAAGALVLEVLRSNPLTSGLADRLAPESSCDAGAGSPSAPLGLAKLRLQFAKPAGAPASCTATAPAQGGADPTAPSVSSTAASTASREAPVGLLALILLLGMLGTAAVTIYGLRARRVG